MRRIRASTGPASCLPRDYWGRCAWCSSMKSSLKFEATFWDGVGNLRREAIQVRRTDPISRSSGGVGWGRRFVGHAPAEPESHPGVASTISSVRGALQNLERLYSAHGATVVC
jgi:hypothetical protein